MTLLLLGVTLVAILISAELFTNALEHLGERFKISEGVTGSLFAAVGTAMPETMVPVVAILSTAATQEVREEVSVGAILGAPLMLSTIALFLIGVAAAWRRGWSGRLRPERGGLQRDLIWFLVAFSLSTLAIFIPHENRLIRGTIAFVLVGLYFMYVLVTVRASANLVAEGHATEASQPLVLIRLLGRFGVKPNIVIEVFQIALGLAGIVAGAHGFVAGIEDLSQALRVSALVLSLLIVPLATELPEKVNSFIWTLRNKDTLAFGNVTGAMVFQGSLLPALGILLTPWEMRSEVAVGLVLTLFASAWLLVPLYRGVLRPYHLALNGLCYVFYIVTVIT